MVQNLVCQTCKSSDLKTREIIQRVGAFPSSLHYWHVFPCLRLQTYRHDTFLKRAVGENIHCDQINLAWLFRLYNRLCLVSFLLFNLNFFFSNNLPVMWRDFSLIKINSPTDISVIMWREKFCRKWENFMLKVEFYIERRKFMTERDESVCYPQGVPGSSSSRNP